MLVFPCTHSMGFEGGGEYSVFQVIHKWKYKQMQLNLAKCVPTVTVIYRTFSGISFCVNRVLDIGVTRSSKFPFNLQNEVRSIADNWVYYYSHRRILSSSNCNFLRDLGSYDFPECVNACMVPFEVDGIFPILASLWTIPLWPTLASYFIYISSKLECTWGCDIFIWVHRVEVLFLSVFFK